MQREARERALNTAMEVFRKNGFRASGVDLICKRGVASRRTLYLEFGSKQGLVLAVLEQYAQQWQEWFFDAAENCPARSEARLWTLWETLDAWVRSEDFRGCLLRQAMLEYADKKHPVHQAAARWKRAIHARIRATATGFRLPGGMDRNFFGTAAVLLFEGALAAAETGGEMNAAREARIILERLLGPR